ncbi:hypothetical protein SPACI_052390 [Sporomusa acidovorans DSM 3132]|uniref:Uncharacterized protein n=1 Tax=Sporomusa acidovorans (strain ATCC 49682 / DSM 3132 / Mol) TaxID=1123286 RepID=A0ABZ3J9M9_SPOA4|nr:hypothetical protein SPACI_18760 [Sporomusa acidovorans DSM 3132]SDD56483.1 hypothetical protein SAMN04488499_100257 [Sporomusa acidovorans]
MSINNFFKIVNFAEGLFLLSANGTTIHYLQNYVELPSFLCYYIRQKLTYNFFNGHKVHFMLRRLCNFLKNQSFYLKDQGNP